MLNNEEKTTATWLKEAQKGYMRVGILILLNKKPSHGYEIMKEIKSRTKGFWSPTPGGVYPILRSLEKAGYITGEWQRQNNRKIKSYRITQSGRLILKNALIKQSEIADNINSLFKEFSKEVLNIEVDTFPMPIMPSPFSTFLDENKELDMKKMEDQRDHILQSIKMHQEYLDSINKKIAEAKRLQIKK